MWHQYCLEEGWGVTRHPRLKDSGRKPDFWVEASTQGFFLEIATVFRDPKLDHAHRRFQGMLNRLNEIDHFFVVGIQCREWLPHDFRVGDLVKFLRAELDKLDPEKDCREERKKIVYRSKGYEIELEIMGKRELAKHPIVGSVHYPVLKGPVGSKQVRGRLQEKIKKYKDIPRLKKPLVVAMCSGEEFFVSTEAVDYELFGKPLLTWRAGEAGGSTGARRDRSGIVVPRKADLSDRKNTRLSAVVYCKKQWGETPGGERRAEYVIEVYHNPWAANPLSEDVFAKLAQFVPRREEGGIAMEWHNRDPDQVVVFL